MPQLERAATAEEQGLGVMSATVRACACVCLREEWKEEEEESLYYTKASRLSSLRPSTPPPTPRRSKAIFSLLDMYDNESRKTELLRWMLV